MAEPKFGPAGNSLSFYAAGMKKHKTGAEVGEGVRT